MAKLAPYVETRQTTNGTAYYYVPPRKLVTEGKIRGEPLGLDPVAALKRANELNAELRSVMAGEAEKKVVHITVQANSVRDLVARYYRDGRFTKLAEASKKSYKALLKLALDTVMSGGVKLGEMQLQDVRPRHTDEFLAKFCSQHSQISAVHCCRIMSRVFQIGYRWELVISNPWHGMDLPELPERTVLWTAKMVETFQAQANEMGYEAVGWVVRTGYGTAQRPKDILALSHENVYKHATGFFVRLTQHKTGEQVSIPITNAALREALDVQGSPFRNPNTGEGYNYFTFHRHYRKVLRAANLPLTLQFRDLRRTVATELGDDGATEAEIMAIGGWRNSRTIKKYLRPSTEQASNAMKKRDAKRSNG